MADMIEALGTVWTGMESSRARRIRSVCVVALGKGFRLVAPSQIYMIECMWTNTLE
jgi:hypothetical protein